MGWHEALKWISDRTSLQVACEVLGVALSPISGQNILDDVDLLNSLGDVLWKAGYPVPKLLEHRRVLYWRKEMERVGFSLSKEEYLQERAAGKSKNQIAHEQGISGPALFHWLRKWGLKDISVENRAIEQLQGISHGQAALSDPKLTVQTQSTCQNRSIASGAPTEFSANRTCAAESSEGTRALRIVPNQVLDSASQVDAKTKKSVETAELLETDQWDPPAQASLSWVEVRLPLPVTDSRPFAAFDKPQSSNSEQDLSRDELMQQALKMLLHAVEWAYNDLTALLGEEAAREQINQYVKHQMETFTAYEYRDL